MIYNIYLDTNIILDFLDKDRKNNHNAIKIIHYLTINKYQIIISEDMLTTIFYIDKKSDRVLKFFKYIQNKWIISSFGKKLIQDAIILSLEKNLDLEDLLQCLCAKKNECKMLITNDKKFYDCGIDIHSSTSFLEKYEN